VTGFPLPPGSVIGMIGGGQLGRMAAMAAARLGYKTHVFSPEPDAPATQVAYLATIADYTDHVALQRFAEAVDVITFEFENVPADGLELLTRMKPIRPGPEILRLSQDRLLEKRFLNGIGIATAPWAEVNDAAELEMAVHRLGLPAVLKTTRLGYDGKGQASLGAAADLAGALRRLQPKPLVLEGFVDFFAEISVIVARGADGVIAAFDPVENRHKQHILDITLAPAGISLEQRAEATRIACHIAERLELVGLLAVEMFVDRQGGLLVNEIAPAIRHSDAVMKNLVGPEDMAMLPEILAKPGLIPHLYGKAEARPGRKMGHFTRLFPKGGLPGEFGIADALRL
jgi:5-(carboxyamino)imidazole ribonucleotide synthase